ncbi:fungal-specific transcription factor domain-containing protein [Lipomyces kononenkoae]|uniref:Fungal-specific transcription factor domain-containing protein n=1 Tax=Lipomyces kononenkoae TaxID=34357 RepID=A0ACC3SSC5_LIPKO
MRPPQSNPDIHNNAVEACPEAFTIQRGADCPLTSKEAVAFGGSDTILLMFYREHLLPFLFPFYRPSLLQGGRAWILEMMISSPVVRRATLCQSSYFFSLGARNGQARCDLGDGAHADPGCLWGAEAGAAGYRWLRHHRTSARRCTDHGRYHAGAAFRDCCLELSNCQAPLNAALALFRQLLDGRSSFNAVMSRLGPPSWILPANCGAVPSAEQAAFRFSSALLIFDDIIAGTVLQEQPRLYEHHRSLLGNIDRTEAPINLEAALGCQNWALLQIGEIAVLDAWKQRRKRAGNLDVMELVHRASAIKNSLEAHLTSLETDPVIISKGGSSMLASSLVTRVWTHAAYIYLFVVVSGWQPASVDVRYHVGRIVELLTRQISPPTLLCTTVWPFCVAGCLAEPAQEAHLRGMVEALQPPSLFGTVRKALEIMENVWRNRDSGDAANRDIATCFRSEGDLILLV